MNSTPQKEAYRAESKVIMANQQNNCTSLHLDGYSLTNLPNALFTSSIYVTLTYLDVSSNKLCSIPKEISILHNLQTFCAQGNQLTSLDSCLLTFKSLTTVDVSRNCISVMPDWLRNMQQLITLNLSGNNISNFNPAVLHVPSLNRLFLVRNPILNISSKLYLSDVTLLREHFDICVSPFSFLSHDCTNNSELSTLLSKCNNANCTDMHHETSNLADLSNSHINRLRLYSSDSDTDIVDFSECDVYDMCSHIQEFDIKPEALDETLHLSSSLLFNREQTPDIPNLSQTSELTSSSYLTTFLYSADVDSKDSLDCSNFQSHTIQTQNVCLTIPPVNLSGYITSDFELNILNNNSEYDPTQIDSTSQFSSYSLISPIIHVGPHGSRFLLSQPAIIKLPLTSPHLQSFTGDILCLFSDTDIDDLPDWQPLPSNNWTYDAKFNQMTISTDHFSLFCVIIRTSYPSNKAWIPANNCSNKEILVPECPGVVLDIPPGAVQNNSVEISVKVLYSNEIYSQSEIGTNGISSEPLKALATPIVMLEPHQQEFSEPVEVTLPLPDCEKILDHFQCDDIMSKLVIQHSDTSALDSPSWRLLTPKEASSVRVWNSVSSSGEKEYRVSFLVHRFCFFRGMWTWLANSMYEAKIGASYLYQQITFNMMCQALMSDEPGSSSFGLNIVVYHADRPFPPVGNFPRRAGGSVRPKAVHSGPIQMRLISSHFRGDSTVGEDVSLIKFEPDFRGREFDKQFACQLTKTGQFSGVLGKVVVERIVSSTDVETIFEFNLIKSENNDDSLWETEDWSNNSIRKLAAEYHVTDGPVWSRLLRYLGFNRREQLHLNQASDPLHSLMVKFQRRGGSGEEFSRAIHRVGRRGHIRRRLGQVEGRKLPSVAGSPSEFASWQLVLASSRTDEKNYSSSSILTENSSLDESSFDSFRDNCRKRNYTSLSTELEEEFSSGSSVRQIIHNRSHKKRRRLNEYMLHSQRSSNVLLSHSYNKNVLKRIRSSEDNLDTDSSDYSRRRSKRRHRNILSRSKVCTTTLDYDEVDHGLPRESSLDQLTPKEPSLIQSTSVFPNAREVACQGVTQDAIFAASTRELSNQELWRLSYPLARFWKVLARGLELDEADVYVIEHEHGKDPRECVYQVFLQWREQWPERCQVGVLYRVLHEAGLKRIGRTYFSNP